MKIIISHDVDHLYGKDHWFRDLFFLKLWVRETLNFIKRNITFHEWFLRCISCFYKEINNINDLVEYDLNHGVPSTFFFGMNQGLSMSYKPAEAKNKICYVKNQGLEVGVHGICYDSKMGILKEKETFLNLMGFNPDGIRMHYVRFDSNTFDYLNDVGYLFDSTDFDKNNCGSVKSPYKIGNMWEFPLCVMDVYLPYSFEKAKKETIKKLEKAISTGCEYFTVLLHDFYYCDSYCEYKKWYEWFIQFCLESNYNFQSFSKAIKELE